MGEGIPLDAVPVREVVDEKNEVRKIWGWKMFQDVSM